MPPLHSLFTLSPTGKGKNPRLRAGHRSFQPEQVWSRERGSFSSSFQNEKSWNVWDSFRLTTITCVFLILFPRLKEKIKWPYSICTSIFCRLCSCLIVSVGTSVNATLWERIFDRNVQKENAQRSLFGDDWIYKALYNYSDWLFELCT